MNEIREVKIEKNKDGSYRSVKIIFGPHFFLDILPDENGILTVYMGATHHGFKAHASDVMDELEKIIEDVRIRFPNNKID